MYISSLNPAVELVTFWSKLQWLVSTLLIPSEVSGCCAHIHFINFITVNTVWMLHKNITVNRYLMRKKSTFFIISSSQLYRISRGTNEQYHEKDIQFASSAHSTLMNSHKPDFDSTPLKDVHIWLSESLLQQSFHRTIHFLLYHERLVTLKYGRRLRKKNG